jgi:hypothetical protein
MPSCRAGYENWRLFDKSILWVTNCRLEDRSELVGYSWSSSILMKNEWHVMALWVCCCRLQVCDNYFTTVVWKRTVGWERRRGCGFQVCLTSCRLLTLGCRALVLCVGSGCLLLVVCCRLSSNDCWLSGVAVGDGCWLLLSDVDCRSLFPLSVPSSAFMYIKAYTQSNSVCENGSGQEI